MVGGGTEAAGRLHWVLLLTVVTGATRGSEPGWGSGGWWQVVFGGETCSGIHSLLSRASQILKEAFIEAKAKSDCKLLDNFGGNPMARRKVPTDLAQ